jgi:hypothetical protein
MVYTLIPRRRRDTQRIPTDVLQRLLEEMQVDEHERPTMPPASPVPEWAR